MVEHGNARAFRGRRQIEEFLAIALCLDFKNALSRGNSAELTSASGSRLSASEYEFVPKAQSREPQSPEPMAYGTTAMGVCQKATLRPFGSSTLT